MATIGYTHGRFQPLHNGHFHTLLKILERFDELWIGIANPLRTYPANIEQLDKELKTSLLKARDPHNNPYTYIERYEMISISLLAHGIDMNRVKILPHFGYYKCEHWKDFIPLQATVVLSIKDYHHYSKVKIYQENGWNVEFIDPLPGISGTIFDQEWPNGKWRELVPEGTKEILAAKLH